VFQRWLRWFKEIKDSVYDLAASLLENTNTSLRHSGIGVLRNSVSPVHSSLIEASFVGIAARRGARGFVSEV